jgi:hypothetical protein
MRGVQASEETGELSFYAPRFLGADPPDGRFETIFFPSAPDPADAQPAAFFSPASAVF